MLLHEAVCVLQAGCMGIDWLRARLRSDADLGRVEALIEQQAVAFQSIWTWNAVARIDWVKYDLQSQLHFPSYCAASKSLRECLDFPAWNAERGVAEDMPDLPPSRRTYAITKSDIFPPLWRLRAHRTFPPDALAEQVRSWKEWTKQAAAGEHDGYLRELHLYHASDFCREHWSCLRKMAINSLERNNAWSVKPEFGEVRETIIRLPEPTVSKVRIEPVGPAPMPQAEFDAAYKTMFEQIKTLIELTRAWDSKVPTNKKLRYYANYYQLTFDAFRAQASSPSLHEFFAWADRCVQNRCVLYLDY